MPVLQLCGIALHVISPGVIGTSNPVLQGTVVCVITRSVGSATEVASERISFQLSFYNKSQSQIIKLHLYKNSLTEKNPDL